MITLNSNAQDCRDAKIPHELFTLNTVLVHIFLPVALLKFGDPRWAIGVPIGISLMVILYTFWRTKKSKRTDPYLVFIHWQTSLNLYKVLIAAYAVYFLLGLVGSWLSAGAAVDMNGENITQTIFLSLSLVPLFVAVLFATVMGSGLIFNASRGEISAKMARKYPQNID